MESKILLEASLRELEENTEKLTKKVSRKEQASKVAISNVELIPEVPSRRLLAKAKAQGSSGTYTPQIEFQDVNYSGDDYTFTGPDGEEYSIERISYDNDVRVTCDCLDFRWRFSLWNSKNKALLGPPPEQYQKKTNRPPQNPQQLPGMCKHLLRLVHYLDDEGVIG